MIGADVTTGRVTGRVTAVVQKGDRYLTDILNDRRCSPRLAPYAGESFAVVVDNQNRSHHVLLDSI